MRLRTTIGKARHRGVVILFVIFLLVALLMFCSLAVDYGRVQTAKTELQAAADGAARAAATTLESGQSAATTAAQQVALANAADGQSIVLRSSDIVFGRWANGSFTSGATPTNAVRVTARRTDAQGNPVPLLFASTLGMTKMDVIASSTAYWVAPVHVDVDVSAKADPWLAGMPDGTTANYATDPARRSNYVYTQDKAPAASPAQLSNMPLIAGNSLTFDSISGTAGQDPGLSDYQPDGNLGYVTYNREYDSVPAAEHGKSNIRSPINAIIGVFLDDSSPTSGSAPSMLDFSSSASRDFKTLAPKLKQVFFIGDGLTSSGITQQFVVPDGATRLYIGMMDGYEWNNNYGSRKIRVERPAQVTLVQ
jgi:Flp pilus assembly protein TadG